MIFYILTLILSFGLPVLGSFTFWKVEHPYDFYRPIVLFIAGVALSFAIVWTFIDISNRLTIKKNKEYEKPTKYHRFLINNGMAFIRRLAFIICKIEGKEKLPKDGPVLLISNHRSNFDNFLLTEKMFMHRHIAFISKPGNFKIPLAGWLMRRLGYLKIDRNDLMQSLEVMKKATQRMNDNITSIGVFPEGTRSKDGKTMGEFHEGVFNIAIRSKKPIVVCSVNGTEKVHKRFPLPTKVTIHLIQTLTYEDYAGIPAKQLSEQIKEMIQKDLDKQDEKSKR